MAVIHRPRLNVFDHSNVLNTGPGFIVHQCNCQGVMGSGIAREIRERFPAVFKAYKDRYDERGWNLGQIQVVNIDEDKFIINAMGQDFFGAGGQTRWTSYDGLAECFAKVNTVVLDYEVAHEKLLPVRFPLIGAGLGGGKWEIIQAIIETELNPRIQLELHLFP